MWLSVLCCRVGRAFTMSKAGTSSHSPSYHIGDLVWCQEAKNHKLWWPAMVTYDPHKAIFFQTTKCLQYHVQYFGLSPLRGWVSAKSCVPLTTGKEKPYLGKVLPNKQESEYVVGMQQVTEAAKLDYKQRKLKFIFSFRPSSRASNADLNPLPAGKAPKVHVPCLHDGPVIWVQSSSLAPKDKKKIKNNADPNLTICSICDGRGSDLLVCRGHCTNSFHLDCLGIMKEPRFKFLCDECVISSGTCFMCRKCHSEVKKCSKPKCSKLYHLECLKGDKLTQWGGGKSSTFTCPLHVCAKCISIGMSAINHFNLLQCIKCPLALHKLDCLVAGCEVIDQAHMLCYKHFEISKNTKLYSHTYLNTCLECGAIGSLYHCDVCYAAYHLECLDQDARPSSDESSHWKCPSCAVHNLPTYGSLVITKFGVRRYVCVCMHAVVCMLVSVL